ncbi:two-partner secretion domain-containing protein [Nostoc sp.]|uniref:two-partner secretion domain-containing protein n=1 Tax=Nostoc sp. TaxID=1180 RepID=UPI002FFB7C0E
MILKSWFGRGLAWKIGGCVALVAVLSIGVSDRVLAQIVPDNTLGAEGSVVTPNVSIQGIPSDRIDGGATRGANLFHSFQDFNVGEGRGAYFANPTGIENILTRVTGSNASNILGRLGILGGANLFLLNPNGIIFGANASLDIKGSFVATTANRVQLGDSGYFSAVEPQRSSLLSVTPGALFFSQVANQPMTIINQGNLSTGKHLTLSAGNLDLQGQLFSGGDLTLQAQDTVKVRDSAAIPFIASAGGNLLVQGNHRVDIFALSDPESGLFSGGDMVLRSSNTVGGDAHYWSGGNFRIEKLDGSLGDLFSPHDPIFRARGDVFINTYQGASLHIFAGGKVEIPGYVWIQGADPENGLVERVNLADGTTVSINGKSEPTLDIRAGVNQALIGSPVQTGTGTLLQPINFTPNPSSADIKIGTILFANAASQPLAGRVLLTNQYQPNSLLSGDIQVTQTLQGEWGGIFMNGGAGNPSVFITSRGGITLDGTVKTSSSSGDGGAISLTAAHDINITGDLDSRSYPLSGNAGQGGAISLTAANDINITGDLDSLSYSLSGNAGQGGAISLTAANDINITGDLDSASWSNSFSNPGNAGQGGAISLTAANDINITGNLLSPSVSIDVGNAGQGGAINLTAANGSITSGDLFSYSHSYRGNAGQGGAIALTAANGSITSGDLFSYSLVTFHGNAGQGGAIALTAPNNINITGNLLSSSVSFDGNTGHGGAISLRTTSGDISGIGNQSTVLSSSSISKQGTAGNGGNVALKAKNNVSNLEILTLSSDSQSGTVQITGLGDLWLTNTNILTSKQVNILFLVFSTTLKVDGKGQSGNVDVSSLGNLTFNNSSTQSDTKGSNSAGDVTVSSPGLVTFNNSFIRSNTSNTGAAGSIGIEAGQGITLIGSASELSAKTTNQGKAGDITLTTPQLTLQNEANIATTTASSSPAGNITLQSHPNTENLNINLAPGTSISASTSNKGTGGNIEIKAPNAITIQGQSTINTETTGNGNAGKIKVNSRNLDIQQTELSTSTTGSGNAGDITLDTSTLTVARGAKVFARTNGRGNSGTITANASTGMNLGIGVEDFSPVISVETSSAGQPGSIIINTPSLTLSNTARITATATNTATNPLGRGSITLNASTMDLAGVVGVFAETQGQTPAGTLTLKPYENQSTLNLTLAPQSLVSASTTGSGKGGNLIVQAPEAITIRGKGQLAVKTTGDGAAGNLTIDTQRLTLSDGATVSASTFSSNPDGVGGNITVNAAQSLDLSNGASLLAQSNGAASAGNITIKTGNLTARNGTIATSSNESSGGGITINASDIHLFDNSDIRTNVASGAGGGGNIKLTANSIIAFGDSDILAYADRNDGGKGGNITLDTRAFFGENYSPASSRNDPPSTLDDNNRVDVNATGAINGVITLPDVSFIQNSLTELPENQINTDSLLANSCIVRRNQPTKGTFTITGTGGLPQRPGDAQMSSFPTVDVKTLPSDSTLSNTNPNPSWQKSDPIVEPQGVYRLPNGKLVLSRECS